MKVLTIIILSFSFLFSIPEEDSNAPFKKCNTIKIVPPENDTAILKNFAALLEEKGMVVQSFNPDIDNLKTEWFIMTGAVNTKSQVFAWYDDTKEDHIFFVTAYYMYGLEIETGVKRYKMAYKNPELSTDGALFQLVDNLCRNFAAQYGYSVYYLKK